MDAGKICVQQILMVPLQNYGEVNLKSLYKSLFYLFFFMNLFATFFNQTLTKR